LVRFTAPEASPAADPDGDGFNNRWEFENGSDRRTGCRRPIESVRVTGQGLARSQTATGKRFQLLSRDTAPGATGWRWVNPGQRGGDELYGSDGDKDGEFYRVQLQELPGRSAASP
jgi:hypothetical protein